MGYDMDGDGKLVINPEQAKIVRRIYREFEEGWTQNEIAKRLNDEGIKGVKGRVAWRGATIIGMLKNEKFKGDALLQKSYTSDYLTKKRKRNDGQVEQYYVEDSHKGIIPKEEWDAVQLEIARRRAYCREVGLSNYGDAKTGSPFISRLVCAHCESAYGRKALSNCDHYFWSCKNKSKEYGKICKSENVRDDTVRKAFVIVWNSVVKDRDKMLGTWEKMKEAGDPLERMRGRQMIELTAQGPLVNEVHELTRMVMERIVIHDNRHFTVWLLDGTVKEVVVTEYGNKRGALLLKWKVTLLIAKRIRLNNSR